MLPSASEERDPVTRLPCPCPVRITAQWPTASARHLVGFVAGHDVQRVADLAWAPDRADSISRIRGLVRGGR